MVCKKWRSLVIPYLFEILSFKLPLNMGTNATHFLPGRIALPPDLIGYIRRLDISCVGREILDPDGDKHFFALLRKCTNLVALNLDIGHNPPVFLDATLSEVSPSLRRLELGGMFLSSERIAHTVTRRVPQVEHLSLRAMDVKWWHRPSIDLPSLHTLDLSHISPFLTLDSVRWNLPRLVSLSLPGEYQRSQQLIFRHMFPKHIKCLVLPRDRHASIDDIQSIYPKLELLHFSPPWNHKLTAPAKPYISLRQVGLEFRVHESSASPDWLKLVEDSLKVLFDREAFPSLILIRCFTFSCVIDNGWREEVGCNLSRPGLRVEDENGRLLFLPH